MHNQNLNLEAQLAEVARRFPGLARPQGIEPYLAARLAESDSAAFRYWDDLYVAYAASQGDVGACTRVAALLDTIARQVAPAAGKLGATSDELADAVQAVRVAMLVGRPLNDARGAADPNDVPRAPDDVVASPERGIARYRGTASLATWLQAAVMKSLLKQVTRRTPAATEDAVLALSSMDDAPDLRAAKRDAAAAIKTALGDALRDLPSDERSLLRAYFLEQQSIDQLAARENAHRATVARRIGRIAGAVRAVVASKLRRRAGHSLAAPNATLADVHAAETSARDVLRLARSQLELSLSRLLKRTYT